MGTPYWRKCGIPQGCPFSMLMVALIMRPWIIIMRKITGVSAYILADDVLVIATGEDMVKNLAEAINKTHSYLHDMGAKVAPDKSYNFASTSTARRWLDDTWWEGIGAKIAVVKDFRYLGAHITTGQACVSSTLTKRWDTAQAQLKRLRYVPASLEAKCMAIRTNIYAAAMYGVVTSQKVAKMSSRYIFPWVRVPGLIPGPDTMKGTRHVCSYRFCFPCSPWRPMAMPWSAV